MTLIAPARRPTVASRRFGYIFTVVLNAVLLYLVNVTPGWQAAGFLTDDTVLVLSIFNTSLVVGIAVNLVLLVSDPPWAAAAGNLVTTVIGLAVLGRMWQVFPFDFSATSFDWTQVLRVALAVGIVGTAIGIVVQVVVLTRALVGLRS